MTISARARAALLPLALLPATLLPATLLPLAAATLLGLAATGAAAQPSAASGYEPRRGQSGKDVIWIPTPDAAVDRMLQMAEVRESDQVVDLGSGDGKIAIAAGRTYRARATGLEFNPDMVELSNRRSREAGVADKVSFHRADIFASDFGSATVVTMYLLPELNLRLRPILFRMAPGTRVVSHSFTMGEWQPDETAMVDNATLFLWRVPANASGTWRVRASAPGEAPRQFVFTQTFQKVEGSASFGPLTASAIRPVLSGDTLSFGLRGGDGTLLQVRAQVTGNRMAGTLARAAGPAQPFEAERVGEAVPIGGVDASQIEANNAARALN